jgi:hypothetical protein
MLRETLVEKRRGNLGIGSGPVQFRGRFSLPKLRQGHDLGRAAKLLDLVSRFSA